VNGVAALQPSSVSAALARDDLAAEVSRARRGVDDLDVPDQRLHGFGDLLDRHVLAARQVVDAVGRDL